MPRLSAVEAVNPAFEHTKAMLFRPFRFRTWIKVGFIAWLAGAAGGSGSFNQGGSLPSGETPSGLHDIEGTIANFLHEHLLLILSIAVFVILISLVFVYLSSRFRFILLDSVLWRDPQIGRGWQNYRQQGNRYFGFMIAFGLLSALVLGLMIGIPLWRAYKSGVFSSGNAFSEFLRILIPMALGLFVFIIVAAIVNSLATDFVTPLMALDNMTIGQSWRALKELAAAEPGAFAGYLGMKLVLSIAVGIATAIAFLIVVLILAIPAFILVVIFIAAIKGAGDVAAVIGVVVGAIGVMVGMGVLFLLILMVTAPTGVFFTAYSLYFFSGRYPKLDGLLWPPTPVQPSSPWATPPPPLPGPASAT
jgi:hypothetical protein